MDVKSIGVAAVVGAIAGGAGSYVALASQLSALEHRLNQSPPIVVVDFVKLAASYPPGISSNELNRLMVKTNDGIVKLKSAGYLVLDAAHVVAAPPDVYLPEDWLK